MADQGDFRFTFEIKSLPTDASPPPEFHVMNFEGEEEISGSYHFVLDLACEQPDVDLKRLLLKPATLMVTADGGARKFHGIISEAAHGGQASPGSFNYRLELRPAMWKLGLSRQSQIHGTLSDVSVIDVVRTELTGTGALGPGDLSSPHLDANDMDFRVIPEEYPLRDYIVQYQESDLNFVCRQLEHYGIFYFFDHSGEREKLILGDSNAAFNNTSYLTEDIAGGQRPLEVRYQIAASDSLWFGRSIFALQCRSQPLPRTLMVRDYNYRLRREPFDGPYYLAAEAEVDPAGHGIVVNYGEHFKDELEGTTLARVRAEELVCRQTLFTGVGDTIAFSAGHVFSLTDHFRDDLNQDYVITRVRHLGRPSNAEDAPALGGGVRYTNEFTAIPASVPFRPERRTPKPVVPGLFNAHVDASGAGERAEIDGEGRYKIRTPFDLSGLGDGTASRYMRRAQPYAGKAGDRGSTGFHFPLLKGTEVICACVNGDPDRPIIAGAVPNPKSATPVSQTNATTNMLRTTSGVRMEFDDARPGQTDAEESTSTGGAGDQGGTLPSQAHYQLNDPEPLSGPDGEAVSELPLQRHFSGSGSFAATNGTVYWSANTVAVVPGEDITVTVSSTATVDLSWITSNGTASSGTHYTAASATGTVSAGNNVTITISGTANNTTANKTFNLRISEANNLQNKVDITFTILEAQIDISDPLWKVHVPNLTGKTFDADDDSSTSDTFWDNYTPPSGQTLDRPRSYIRRGSPDDSEQAEAAYYDSAGSTSSNAGYGTAFSSTDRPGGFDFIDGDRIEWTTGHRDIVVGGKHRFVIVGGGLNVWDAFPLYLQKSWVDSVGNWHSSKIEAGLSESINLSDSKSLALSSSADFKIGLGVGASAAASFSASAGISSSFSADASWSMSKSKSLVIASEAGSNVTDEVKFEVQTDPTWNTATTAIVTTLAAVVAGGAAIGVGLGTTSCAGSTDDDGVQAMHGTFEIMRGLCLAAFAATLAHGLLRQNGVTRTEFKMDGTSINLGVKNALGTTDESFIKLKQNSIEIKSQTIEINGDNIETKASQYMEMNCENNNGGKSFVRLSAGKIELDNQSHGDIILKAKNNVSIDGLGILAKAGSNAEFQ